MKTTLLPIFTTLARALRSRALLHLEILALRQQVAMLAERDLKRIRSRRSERVLWVWLYRLWPACLTKLKVFKPETVVGWHRQGYRLYWNRKSRHRRGGRPPIDPEVRELIRTMSKDNIGWGAPRIHGELQLLGIQISQSTVATYMIRHRRPPSQTWRTFLDNHVSDLVSIDFFTVPTVSFRIMYVLVILHHKRRKVLHFNVTEHPTAEWTAQQIVETFPFDSAPRYLLRDRDCIYGERFRSRVINLGIQEVMIAPRSPWQSPYVERLIGSIRRECLNHVLIFNEKHLRQRLRSYFTYYHQARTHLSLNKQSPQPRVVEDFTRGKVIAIRHLGGLHHEYRVAA